MTSLCLAIYCSVLCAALSVSGPRLPARGRHESDGGRSRHWTRRAYPVNGNLAYQPLFKPAAVPIALDECVIGSVKRMALSLAL